MLMVFIGMLLVRENVISLRKWTGGAAQLRTLEGTWLVLLNSTNGIQRTGAPVIRS